MTILFENLGMLANTTALGEDTVLIVEITLSDLRASIERMRAMEEALQFYANPASYSAQQVEHPGIVLVLLDAGNEARAALRHANDETIDSL